MKNHAREELLKIILEELFKKKVLLKIKDNRSTFLSSKSSFGEIKIFLHKAFLDAPFYILISLREYLLKNRKGALLKIKIFMENYFQEKDYSSDLDKDKLETIGKKYNLKEILDLLNKKYFKSSIDDINISWFKKPSYKKKESVTFGSYDKSLKLIKVNKLLDDEFFPEYFVSYVVFHELLHSKYPIIYDKRGRRKIHYKEFKEAEAEFEHYERAQIFEKNYLKKRNFHGRT